MSEQITPAPPEQVNEILRRLAEGLARSDPHHRLLGRPVSYRRVDGHTLEITCHDVPGIAEAELLGVKRLLGEDAFSTVSPQTAESVTLRFVVACDSRHGSSEVPGSGSRLPSSRPHRDRILHRRLTCE